MDREVIINKLENLRRCVARVELKRPDSLSALIDDVDAQDIIVLNLERAVQVCVDIGAHIISNFDHVSMPGSMSETFHTLKTIKLLDEELAGNLTKAVGFRNTAVHTYQEISWEIVYAIITERLVDFRDFTRAVMEFIDKK